jgi:flavorubredoxin
VAIIENGSWAPTSGKLMRDILTPLKNTEFIADNITVKASLAPDQLSQLDALADAIAADIK